MIVVNGLRSCDNCRKAIKALEGQGVPARLRDLREEPVAVEEIGTWHAQFGGDLLNMRSTTWRNLPESERLGDSVALMAAHPALIKRPVFETTDGLYLGWTPATREALGLSE